MWRPWSCAGAWQQGVSSGRLCAPGRLRSGAAACCCWRSFGGQLARRQSRPASCPPECPLAASPSPVDSNQVHRGGCPIGSVCASVMRACLMKQHAAVMNKEGEGKVLNPSCALQACTCLGVPTARPACTCLGVPIARLDCLSRPDTVARQQDDERPPTWAPGCWDRPVQEYHLVFWRRIVQLVDLLHI